MNVEDARARFGLKETSRPLTAFKRFERAVRPLHQRIVLSGEADAAEHLEIWKQAADALRTVIHSMETAPIPRNRTTDLPPPKVPWPVTPTEDRIREVLNDWARARKRVRTNAFNGDLTISDASSAFYRVRRLIEHRTEAQRVVPGSRAPEEGGTYTGRLKNLIISPPKTMRDHAIAFIKEGSIRTYLCDSCTEGVVRCGRCSGTGREQCKPTERCKPCAGRGEVNRSLSDPSSEMVRCPSCHGMRTIPCRFCGGRGSVLCGHCDATGIVTCVSCRGTAALTSYTEGSVEWTVDSKELRAKPVPSPIPAKLTKHVKSYQTATTGVPDGLPAVEAEAIWDLVDHKPEAEVKRDLKIEILPITRVTYSPGRTSRTAYIVGDDHTPVVPSPPLTNGFRIAISAGLVALAALLSVFYTLGIFG